MLKPFMLVVAISASTATFAALTIDTFECQGAYWKYHYRFKNSESSETCEYASEQTKGFPENSLSGKAEIKFKKMDIIECWRGMARVQVAGAACCIRTKGGKYSAADVRSCD